MIGRYAARTKRAVAVFASNQLDINLMARRTE
jgi:hypothetical protein